MGETGPMSKLQQVTQLTTLVKSTQVGPKKNNPYKGCLRKSDNQNNNGSEKEYNNGNTRMQLKGPETGPKGLFGPGQRPIQCYKCKVWGHPRHLCPSQLNFSWGDHGKESTPTQESVETQTPPTPAPQNQ